MAPPRAFGWAGRGVQSLKNGAGSFPRESSLLGRIPVRASILRLIAELGFLPCWASDCCVTSCLSFPFSGLRFPICEALEVFQPRGLDSRHLQHEEILRQASLMAQLEKLTQPPRLGIYQSSNFYQHVWLGPVSFLLVGTTHPFDSLMVMVLVQTIRAVAGLELHGLNPSGDPSFHGPGLAALCKHLPWCLEGILPRMHLGVGRKASMQPSLQPLQNAFSAASALPPNGFLEQVE